MKPTPVYKHDIKLKPNADVVCIKQYRVPFAQRDELQKQVMNWEKMGVIQKSTSRFNSPLMLVKKQPDSEGRKQFRAVLDYNQLNKICIPQLYPLPLPDELFDMLHGSTVYTVLDVYAAYHQVELEESCRYITAFSALNHHYEFKMLPFGLQSSGIGWLYAIHRVLQKFINKGVFVYVDDVCLWSSNESDHVLLIKRVLKQLIKCNIKLKPEKCKFLQNHIFYLGYKISKKGLEVDHRKTACIKKYPIPKNLKELQRFIGFVNFYRKYIPEFSRIALPLYKLCKKDSPYIWNDKTQLAFDLLREKLMNPPVLAYPCFDLPFVVISDASNYAAAAILTNRDGKDERPIQYFSRTFNDAQSRYSTVHKELLAAIWGITWFRSFLLGRPFYLVVDQKSLIYILSGKFKETRVHRWAIELMEYDFQVIHREGKLNCADALSRIRINEEELTKDEKPKIVCLVQTRSKTSELQKQTHPKHDGKSKDVNKDRSKFYQIIENKGFQLQSSKYDQIIFFLDDLNCRLSKQLQHKMKKIVEIDNLNFGEIYQIDENKCILLVPRVISTQSSILETEKSVKTLVCYLTQNNFEKVAFNVDFPHHLSYLQFKKIIRDLFSSTQIQVTIYLNQVIVVTDVNEINKILYEFHNTISAGHAGWNRMYQSIKRYYSWNNMISDIKKYAINCEKCQKSKLNRHTKQPMTISSTPTTSFQNIAIDHVGKIITSAQGNSYILTVLCVLTKYAIAIPVPDTGAQMAARALVEKVFLIYGYPEQITSDNHKTFESGLFKSINKLLKIHHVFTSPFTPKSNTVERFHKTLGNMLRIFVDENPSQWEVKLPYVISAYNNSVSTATNRTPFELVFGKSMALPVTGKPAVAYNYDDYAKEIKENLHYGWKLARETIEQRKIKNKEYFDNKNVVKDLELKIGDLVLMKNTKRKSKYEPLYLGPYEVIEITGPNTVKLIRNKKIVRAHKDQLKSFKSDDNIDLSSDEE